MYFKKKLVSAAAVAAMAALLFGGGRLTAEGGGDSAEGDGSSLLPWSAEKETIYFWYSDENMTNFLNSAAVSFGEREDWLYFCMV